MNNTDITILIGIGIVVAIYIVYKISSYNNKHKNDKFKDIVVFMNSQDESFFTTGFYYIKDIISFESRTGVYEYDYIIFYGNRYDENMKKFNSRQKHHIRCDHINTNNLYLLDEFKHLTGCK